MIQMCTEFMSFTAFDVPDEIKDYAESGGKEGIVD